MAGKVYINNLICMADLVLVKMNEKSEILQVLRANEILPQNFSFFDKLAEILLDKEIIKEESRKLKGLGTGMYTYE